MDSEHYNAIIWSCLHRCSDHYRPLYGDIYTDVVIFTMQLHGDIYTDVVIIAMQLYGDIYTDVVIITM